MLDQFPQLSLWDYYICLAAQLNHQDEMFSLIQKHLEDKNLKDQNLFNLKLQLVKAYLAMDEIDKALSLIRELMDFKMDSANKQDQEEILNQKTDLSLRLLKIGHILNHPEWIKEGINFAKKIFIQRHDFTHPYSTTNAVENFIEILLQLEKRTEAEAFLIGELETMLKSNQYKETEKSRSIQTLLFLLMKTYTEAKQYEDVKILLDQISFWGARDLRELEERYYFVVASSLFHLGNKEQAALLLKEYLYKNGGDDLAYELLIEIEGSDLIPWLDQQFNRDQYEERPLIWKAVLLKKEGELIEAQKTAEKAISIDPSDGEQPHGHRMLVYEALSQILSDQGKKQEADFYNNVMKAIRMAEEADDYIEAGLISRGIQRYQQSLEFFTDAYCIQSRLAIHLEEVGSLDLAEQHYRKAYELMPDSFGRVESHCFGCEGVFNSPQAKSVAEKIFDSLLTASPQKPQVHYLMGYLKEKHGQFKEAAQHYRKATEVDPDYLNAYSRLNDLSERIYLPASERDVLMLNLLRLDPMKKHVYFDLSQIKDLKGLWSVLSENQKLYPAIQKSLYPFKTSQIPQGQENDQMEFSVIPADVSDEMDPARIMANNEIIQKIVALLEFSDIQDVHF